MNGVTVTDRIDALGRDAWNACFPDTMEDFDYLHTVSEAGLPGFQWAYVGAYADGILRAAMPAFLCDYALDTTLEGTAKKISALVRYPFPSALKVKLACLGSPVTDYGLAGFHPDVAPEEKSVLLGSMLQGFEQFAQAQGCRLSAVKDIPQFQESVWEPVMRQQQYQAVPGLPVAYLPIDFADMNAYFSRLSPDTRKDMRRKLKSLGALRIEHCTHIHDVLPQVMALYRDTRNRAAMQFEELTESYFTELLHRLPGRAFCTLYFQGEELLAFNFLLHDGTTLLDKFFCMDGVRGREHNLYFVSWFTNIDYCLRHGVKNYQSGQAAYENKLRLGSKLVRTSMHFKHRNRLIHGALKLAAPLLVGDSLTEAA